MILVIAGVIDIDPTHRDAALRGAETLISDTLKQPGCMQYAWTADVLTPGRIYVFEEWKSQEDFAAHLSGPYYRAMLSYMQQFRITNAVTKKYRVDLSEPVYDPNGRPRADFFTSNR
ncbi:MAG: antibiotic biosynthesis monooxygenase [Deltaproteobacteria bacterium]|nr:antibiotic biosynthesis monooxygenase [Deltaproteobacteria bacterium]